MSNTVAPGGKALSNASGIGGAWDIPKGVALMINVAPARSGRAIVSRDSVTISPASLRYARAATAAPPLADQNDLAKVCAG